MPRRAIEKEIGAAQERASETSSAIDSLVDFVNNLMDEINYLEQTIENLREEIQNARNE